MKIGKTDLNKQPYLIAEIGINHQGSFKKAKKMVIAAAQNGANAVKFQLFSLDTLIQPEQFEKVLKIDSTKWRDEFRKLEFPLKWLKPLKKLSDKLNVDFLCTPFDTIKLERYLEIDPVAIKIASGDLTNHLLIKKAATSKKPIILSTGTGTKKEIEAALALMNPKKTILLDCVVNYPANILEYDLKSFKQLSDFKTTIGISDHTDSIFMPSLAIYNGGSVVEKHFTLDKKTPGADHAISCEPAELQNLAKSIQDAFNLSHSKPLKRSDLKERKYARRAIYAKTDIAKGEVFNETNTIALRPALNGIGAQEYKTLFQEKARNKYTKGAIIKVKEIKGKKK